MLLDAGVVEVVDCAEVVVGGAETGAGDCAIADAAKSAVKNMVSTAVTVW